MFFDINFEDIINSGIKYNNAYYYVFKSCLVRCFEISLIDLENSDLIDINAKLSSLFAGSDPGIRYRFIYDTRQVPKGAVVGLREGFTKHNMVRQQSIYLVCEYETSVLDFIKGFKERTIKTFEDKLNIDLLNQIFIVRNCELTDLPKRISDFKYSAHYSSIVNREDEQFGVLKLKNLTTNYIHPASFGYYKNAFGFDATVVTTIVPYSKARSEVELRRLSKRRDAESDLTGIKKKADTEKALTDITLEGQSLCELDVTILCGSKKDYSQHISALSRIKGTIDRIGEFSIEKHTALGAYYSCCVGQTPSMGLQEITDKVSAYLPIFSESDPITNINKESKGLVLQRRDYSLSYFYYFQKVVKSNNYCIIGEKGSGKSVLSGLLLTNTSKKDNYFVTILDVGSSHIHTVSSLGGKITRFSLSEPSGMNPFKLVTSTLIPREDRVELLCALIKNLVLEVGEKELSNTLSFDIENAVITFINEHENSNKEITIDDFIDSTGDFPRKKLIMRFGKNGKYKNLFKSDPNDGNRTYNLEYFDFKEVMQATGSTFSSAGMSALIFHFSYLVLTEKLSKKILIIDEVPTFIEHSYNYLCTIAAQIRKYGGSICIIAQSHKQLCPNGKKNLLSHFKHKFLFSADGDIEDFTETLGVDPYIYEKVKSLNSEMKVFSEVLYTNGKQTKTYILTLTPEEYYRLTTDDNDKTRIAQLKASVSGLTHEQAIRFYSLLEEENGKNMRFL